jgi:hypothetical protein
MADFTAMYIAVAVTVLGMMILSSVGTNNDQNRRIAQQARAIAEGNRKDALNGCQRGNFVRTKINTVSGALTQLLRRSVRENEESGQVLTPSQEVFLDKLYEKLAPLKKIDCKQEYGR